MAMASPEGDKPLLAFHPERRDFQSEDWGFASDFRAFGGHDDSSTSHNRCTSSPGIFYVS